jgi:hypothetical protein
MSSFYISKAKQPMHALNMSLNKDKELNLTTNHRSPRAKKFTNYALKTRIEGVLRMPLTRHKQRWKLILYKDLENIYDHGSLTNNEISSHFIATT